MTLIPSSKNSSRRPAHAWTPNGTSTNKDGSLSIDSSTRAARFGEVELLAAKTDDRRLAIRQRHVSLLKEIENREEAEIQVGRGTASDLAEARQRRLEAQIQIKISEKEAAEKASIVRRLSELERKVDEIQGKPGGKSVNTP